MYTHIYTCTIDCDTTALSSMLILCIIDAFVNWPYAVCMQLSILVLSVRFRRRSCNSMVGRDPGRFHGPGLQSHFSPSWFPRWSLSKMSAVVCFVTFLLED